MILMIIWGIGFAISIIVLIETFIMFYNIKSIKNLLLEQIDIQNQLLIRVEDLRTTIKNQKD